MAQNGKRVLITGASSGIGREAARQLAARGFRLGLVARRAERLQELARTIGANGHPQPEVFPTDLAERGAAANVAAEAEERLGAIDVLVNNAGGSMQGLTWVAGDDDVARRVFETNVWSPLALAAAVAPAMVTRGQGAIVNTGSMIQVSPFPHLGHYAASRAALALATEAMRLELAPRGVRVVEVAFGPVDTAGSTENRILAGGDEWLDGRPGLGELGAAAKTLVRAVEKPVDGVLFYPRIMRWAHVFPTLARQHARRAAKRADLIDTTVRVGGHGGAAEVRAAREDWEREHVEA